MTENKKMVKDTEVTDQNHEQRDFLDPATTATIGWFVFVEISKACIAFFTMKALRIWWVKKFGKDKETDVGENESYQGTSDQAIPEEESGEEA